jgi:hypothetical protein
MACNCAASIEIPSLKDGFLAAFSSSLTIVLNVDFFIVLLYKLCIPRQDFQPLSEVPAVPLGLSFLACFGHGVLFYYEIIRAFLTPHTNHHTAF